MGFIAKKKVTMSMKEAEAYKALAEGKAAIVTAWMPLLLLVAGAGITILILCVGDDLTILRPVVEIVSALLK
jgi:hypothetical protein